MREDLDSGPGSKQCPTLKNQELQKHWSILDLNPGTRFALSRRSGKNSRESLLVAFYFVPEVVLLAQYGCCTVRYLYALFRIHRMYLEPILHLCCQKEPGFYWKLHRNTANLATVNKYVTWVHTWPGGGPGLWSWPSWRPPLSSCSRCCSPGRVAARGRLLPGNCCCSHVRPLARPALKLQRLRIKLCVPLVKPIVRGFHALFEKNLTICFLPFERVQFPYTLCAQLLSFFIEFHQWCFFSISATHGSYFDHFTKRSVWRKTSTSMFI